MKENCYNWFQNTCMAKNGNSCPSDHSRMCMASDSLDAPLGAGGCYDTKSTSKCLKKKNKIKKGRSKCSKPNVARKCRKTCGLCYGAPPPSPAPPPAAYGR